MGTNAARLLAIAGWLCLASAATTHSTAPQRVGDAEVGRVSLRVRDAQGRSLSARVRIEASSLRERVRLGLGGAPAKSIAVVGEADLALVAGDYRIWVSHGPEWSLERDVLHVTAGAQFAKSYVLTHQVELAGFRGADLHVHTQHSNDAQLNGGVDVATTLRAEGVELAVATDHNRVGDLGPGAESLAGAEITTWMPEVGHFNAFPLRRLPAWKGTTPVALARELRRDPAVFVQVNHPRLEHHISYFSLGGFDGERFERPGFHLDVDGLEVWNGYDLARPNAVLRLLREWRAWIARGRRLTATGGSDSHGASGHYPGYPRTYVRAEVAADLAPALKAGRAFVTNGPLLALDVSGRGLGESVLVQDRSVSVELRVLAPDWMRVEHAEIWAGERLAWRADIAPAPAGQPLRYSARVRVRTHGARTLVAVAHGGHGLDELLGRTDVAPLAFTNPIYLAHARPSRERRVPPQH